MQDIDSYSNPYQRAFERLGTAPEFVTETVNLAELNLLTDALTNKGTGSGRVILLRSPRAGFGKTHLLERLRSRLSVSHSFFPLEPVLGRDLNAESIIGSVMRNLVRPVTKGDDLTVLDVVIRRVLAIALEPLVKSGDVPSQDKASALESLRKNPVETFDFYDPDAITAQWALSNFHLLQPRLVYELCAITSADTRAVSWWVSCLFSYSAGSLDGGDRAKIFLDEVMEGGAAELDHYEKLLALLSLVGLVVSPVLVLDEVEGYYGNPEAGLQVCGFLNALHQAVDNLSVIISTNNDIWETAFKPRLSGGLKDRITDFVVDLKPLPKGLALLLLKQRDEAFVEYLKKEIDFDLGVTYSRGLIKRSAELWDERREAGKLGDYDKEVKPDDILSKDDEDIDDDENSRVKSIVFSEPEPEPIEDLDDIAIDAEIDTAISKEGLDNDKAIKAEVKSSEKSIFRVAAADSVE